MSKLETNTIDNISGSSTLTIGDSNTSTITLKSGATLTNFPANTPAFQATLSGNQTINHNTITKIQFNSETFDTNSSYDPTTNYRFTVPSGEGGKYFIYTSINLQGANNREYETILRIRVNGSDNKITIAGEDLTQSTVMKFNLSTVVSLSATDYVEIYVFQYDYTASATVNVLDNTRAVFGGYKLIGV